MEELVHFLFEAGHLKNVDRSGWWLLGNKNPESVAEHSFRCTILGYILAKLENVDASKVLMMCLFHDVHETRTNDLHKVVQKYINLDEAGDKATQDQIEPLQDPIGKEISDALGELTNQESKESVVAKRSARLGHSRSRRLDQHDTLRGARPAVSRSSAPGPRRRSDRRHGACTGHPTPVYHPRR